MSKRNPTGQELLEDRIPIVGKKNIGKEKLTHSIYTFKAVYSYLSN